MLLCFVILLHYLESVREAKKKIEKALDVSNLWESDEGKSVKRQRFVTQRYSSFLKQSF